MLDTIEAPATELVSIPRGDALTFFTTEGAVDPILARIRKEIDAFVPDISTVAGRKDIASMAHKVAQAKTFLDGAGKDLVAKMKELPKKIDASRRHIRETLDQWKDEVRKPLTDWETAEDARIDRHQVAISRITTAAAMLNLPAAELRAALATVEEIVLGDYCEEFLPEYALAKDAAIAALRPALAAREQYEADQAELARLRAEDEARKVREREEAIRREGEERAKREADAKVEAEKAASVARAAAERQAAEQRELALRRQAEAAVEAARQAATDREAALQRQVEDAKREAAETQARIERAAKEKADREAAETAAREADRNHRAAVNRAALDALIAGGIAEDIGKTVITLIASKRIPAISISY